MADRTAEEAEKHYIEKMGEALGTQYYALWQEVAWLHRKWAEFVELFGSKPTRIELLNQTAPAFFRMGQDVLWEETLLHIARLTDVSKTGGRDKRTNLTIRNLPELVIDPEAQQATAVLIETAVRKANFCRDWRNRHIAHSDLGLALNNKAAAPLEFASRRMVKEALGAIAEVLKYLGGYYMDSDMHFGGGPSIGGAASLLLVLDGGLRAKTARAERLGRGEFTEEDRPRDL
jgi:hypothetical protein